ncbi:MAG: trigger factor [Nitrosomonadales bacterium]|nr:trigger factor [Nitrosomonadales bacterium]|tara:strand:- start:53 stop:1363 length:1311 start_codon:yes stop_codon:yes gene_type:complete
MSETIEKLGSIERKVKGLVNIAPFQSEISQRFIELTRTARVAGFRPGKVPLEVVEKQYGSDIKAEIYAKAIEMKFGEIVNTNNLRVAGMPDIQHDPLDKVNDDFEFTATFEVFPEFKLGNFKELKISKKVVDVNADDVKKTIDVLIKQRAVFEKVDRESKLGDQVIVQLQSFLEGEQIESTGDQSLEFVLGDSKRIKAVDDQLVGIKSGQTKEFEVKYPKDHDPAQLADKKIKYQVKLIEVREPKLPKIDANFAKSLGVESGDLKKMNEEIKASLTQEVEKRVNADLKKQVFQLLIDSHDMDVPKSLVTIEINRMMQVTNDNLKKQGANMKEVKLERVMFEERAVSTCKLRIVLASLVDANKLEASEEQIKSKVSEFAANFDDTEKAEKWFYDDPKRLEEPTALSTEDNVVDWFLKECKIETKKISFDDLMAMQGA